MNREVDPRCPLCGGEQETTYHLFAQCHLSRALWYESWWSIKIDEIQISNLDQWIDFLFDPPWFLKSDEDQRCKFLVFGALVIEWVWKCRNQVVFENKFVVNEQVCKKLIRIFHEHWVVAKLSSNNHLVRRDLSWTKPPQSAFKLNCDATIEDSSSAIVVIARDWRGLLMFAVTKKVDTDTPIEVEAKAILWVVNLACQANFVM